ncbi:MAG TPA: hypothetical protein VLG46_13450 [Anaerolineae bacterium]|nr:hypothetical protein [Anaerolineae bacterium]
MSADLGSPSSELRYCSQLFTVRLWREQLNDHWEWRGKVQHVMSGETRYFRDWQTLIDFFQAAQPTANLNEGKTRL